jgi:paraquat-inducible protein A
MSVLSAAELGLVACRTCGATASAVDLGLPRRCARCRCTLHARRPRSFEKSLAWLLAGVICYVPANVLPVMYASGVGGGHDSTILGGVLGFWRAGSWGIALVIFLASVAVPATKFLGLGLLLWTVRKGVTGNEPGRSKLYHAIESIGYWSMLDVAVVGLTAALLQFDDLGRAEPRIGIAFFCATVVFTMLSALSFDERLIWDGAARHG